MENEATEGGGGGGGNMRAQFLGKVLTITWTMLARPQQSECFAHTGPCTPRLSYATHSFGTECGTKGVRYQRPLSVQGQVLLEGLLDAEKEGVYGLLTPGVGHLSGDAQEVDYGVSMP